MANRTMRKSAASSWWEERSKILAEIVKSKPAKKARAKKATKAKKPAKAKKVVKAKKVKKTKRARRA
jgi:hypothetical protein